MELSDSDFSALRRGDQRLFEKLYLHHEKSVYNFILAKTGGDRTVTEEVFSDTFFSAFRSVGTLRHPDNIQGWLLRIASRRLVDHLRKTYREEGKRRAFRPGDASGADVLDEVIRRERKAMFDLALDRLKADQRRALELKYFEEKSVEEIAALLGAKPSTVEGLLHRARQSLKKALERLSYA